MSDKVFVDSNVWIYTANNDAPLKKSIAIGILQLPRAPLISPQVVFECINVCRKKLKMSDEEAFSFAEKLLPVCELVSENGNIVRTALRLCRQAGFQPFDAKIVATALEAGCNLLYSEDMQHKLVINNTLTIINPFI